MNRPYRTIFFDLDHTLWDYETSSRETLEQLALDFGLLEKYGIQLNDFLEDFRTVNRDLWKDYDAGTIDREAIRLQRFRRIMRQYYVEDEYLHLQLSDEYLSRCPVRANLLPYALECLEYLSSRYKLCILTNGFDDVQNVKLSSAGISRYFQQVITSETTGHRKPSPEIFRHALAAADATPDTTLMIGDNLHADVAGALNAQLHAMYYNPDGNRHTLQPHYEIRCLSEIRNLL